MKKDTKNSRAIETAAQKGYTVTKEGQVVSPLGKVRKLIKHGRVDKPPYYRFNIGVENGKSYPVAVHRLVAHLKCGEASLEEEIHVRHLDGNSLNNSWDNIAIGTASDNMMDVPKEVRVKNASSANQKFTPEEIQAWRQDHQSGLGYKKLRKKYGVGLSTLSYYLSDNAKKKTHTYSL